jgi:hypothetical protein
MNLGDVKVRVKRQFGDESGVQVTDGDILRWVNDAQRDIVNQNEGILETVATADLVQGTGEYSFPPACFVIRSISVKMGTGLSYFKVKHVSFQEFDQNMDGWDGTTFAQSISQFWTSFSNLIKLFPVPNESVVGGLKIYYQRHPTDVVNDSDVLDLPIQYHNAVVNTVLAQAYEMDEDWDSSGNKSQQATADITANREREKWDGEEFYPTITVRPEDSDDFYQF